MAHSGQASNGGAADELARSANHGRQLACTTGSRYPDAQHQPASPTTGHYRHRRTNNAGWVQYERR